MARLLALDWDQLEARIVVARPKGDGIAIEKTIAVPLSLSTQQTAGDFNELSEQLVSALQTAGVSKSQVITALGRSMIELGTLQLPPAPPEELPDMVRFQAMREFSSLQENSLLDFFPLGESGNESGEVIAAAIPQELAEKVGGVLTQLGHEPQRTVMRPFAFASLAMRIRPASRSGNSLIISQQADSAELAVMKDGLVVFTRSFRLPPDWAPGESGEPLLGEVRRTIAAAQNQLGQSRVERILLFGTPGEHADLCERLRDRTKLEVELLDPFDGVTVADKPAHPERFAAALGSLRDETSSVAPVIDFLNPRKKPEVESPTRKRLVYGGFAAVLLLGVAALVMWQYRSLDKQIATAERTLAKLKNENKNLQPVVNLAKELEKWKSADRNWLEELAHLSTTDGLDADDFMITVISGRNLRDTSGEIDIQGRSQNLEAEHKFHEGLSDEQHNIEPYLSTPIRNKDDTGYERTFKTRIETSMSIPIVPKVSPPQQAPPKQSPEQPPATNEENEQPLPSVEKEAV